MKENPKLKNSSSSDEGLKRLFFGLEITAPWPDNLARGRVLKEQNRHLTLAFLGKADVQRLTSILPSFPAPSFAVGTTGKFDKCLFLPPHHPHVAAYHAHWFENEHPIIDFQKQLVAWLNENQFNVREHEEFLAHVTICRRPFSLIEWKKNFRPLPFTTSAIHLYESLGRSEYQKIWSYSLIPPFVEIEHTADAAFIVNSQNIPQLHQHAKVALAFLFPEILPYLSEANCDHLDAIVCDLNRIIARADTKIGCPFKAVSFHGQAIEKNHILSWEMIIDV